MPDTNTLLTYKDLTIQKVVSFSRTLSLTAGDYVEIMFAVNDLNIILPATVITAVGPATPSAFVNLTRIE